MAKTLVKLLVDGYFQKEKEGREVASLTYSLSQSIDRDGQVADIVRGGLIVIRLKAYNDGNRDMFSWMTEQDLAKNGQIVFMNPTDTSKTMKTIKFEDAYCVNYVEHWEDDVYDIPFSHWEEITISCRVLNNEGVSYMNDWTMRRDEAK